MSRAVAEIEPLQPEPTAERSGDWFSTPPRHSETETLPEWYRSFQTDSWHQFLETPEPARTDENWRFANLKQVRFESLALAAPLEDASPQIEESRTRGLQEVSARFIFANNRLVHSEVKDLQEGVLCLPLNEAILSHGDLVRSHFLQEEARLGSAKFAFLHGSASLSGVFVHVPRNVTVEKPIEISHWVGGENAVVFPHVLVVTETGASVSVVERHRSTNDTDSTLSIGVADLAPEAGSRIQYTSIQNLNNHSRQIQMNGTRVARDSQAISCFVNLGARWIRNESVSRLTEPGADSRMLSANLADHTQEFDQRTLQLHEAEHTTSDLLYKNALYHQARTIFSGLIRVSPGAHHTDAYQKCRNLLGSDEAEANSMPGLEIDADQVKCSHGSTSGQISDEEIFYLQARGIAAREARQIISQGFLNQAISHLEGEELKEAIAERFATRFRELA